MKEQYRKVFIDSDIILDVVFKRIPYFKNSQSILGIIENNFVNGFTSILALANCYYIIESNMNNHLNSNQKFDFKKAKIAFEKAFIQQKLMENHNNITNTAKAIGIERNYLYRIIKKYSIKSV